MQCRKLSVRMTLLGRATCLCSRTSIASHKEYLGVCANLCSRMAAIHLLIADSLLAQLNMPPNTTRAAASMESPRRLFKRCCSVLTRDLRPLTRGAKAVIMSSRIFTCAFRADIDVSMRMLSCVTAASCCLRVAIVDSRECISAAFSSNKACKSLWVQNEPAAAAYLPRKSALNRYIHILDSSTA